MTHHLELVPDEPITEDKLPFDLNGLAAETEYFSQCHNAIHRISNDQVLEAAAWLEKVEASARERTEKADQLKTEHKGLFLDLSREVAEYDGLVEFKNELIAERDAKTLQAQTNRDESEALLTRLTKVEEKLISQRIKQASLKAESDEREKKGLYVYTMRPDIDEAHSKVQAGVQENADLASKFARTSVAIKRLEAEIVTISNEKLPNTECTYRTHRSNWN